MRAPDHPMTDRQVVYVIVAATLGLVLVAVIGVLLAGLFNPLVDNDKIFAILGPAFQTIVGAFVGILSGMVINSKKPDGP